MGHFTCTIARRSFEIGQPAPRDAPRGRPDSGRFTARKVRPMSARLHRGLRASVTTAFLLLWGTTPAAGNDRLGDAPTVKPAIDLTASVTAAFVPTATVAPFVAAAQSQTLLKVPASKDDTGFSGTAVRRGLIASFAALQLLDAHSTMKALNAGGREANPAMSAIASNSATLFAVKAGTAAATAYFVERLSKKHPKGAVVVMAVLNSAYVAVVAHNYRVANR